MFEFFFGKFRSSEITEKIFKTILTLRKFMSPEILEISWMFEHLRSLRCLKSS